MHIPTKSSALYFVRIVQTAIALGFLILICWCGVHRAWWDNINGTLAVGVIATILTFTLSGFSIVSHHRNSNPFSGSTGRTVLRIVIEVVLLLVYIAAAGLMLKPKGGCNVAADAPGECFGDDSKDAGPWNAQPLVEWDVAIVFSFVQIISYLVSILLVFMETKESKVGGGASYA